MKKAIFVGSFDPLTIGHIDVIKQAASVFDCLVVAVAEDNEKQSLFDISTRIEIAKHSIKGIKGVMVEAFSGLLTDFAKNHGTNIIVRGLREKDFALERELKQIYQGINSSIEVIYFISESEISSSAVRQVLSLGGSIENFVSKEALKIINNYETRGREVNKNP